VIPLDRRALLFAFNCYLAAMLALSVGFLFNMPNPWWASLTVYLTSQPQNGAIGAVWGRALYRLTGTVVGMIAALAIVPLLSNTPEILIVVIALWAALCVYCGLLDRSPRAYAFLLSGFTFALVGFPAVNDPGILWDSAVLRTEQIGIGVLCAAVVHSLLAPRTVQQMVQGKLTASIADVRRWIHGALDPAASSAEEAPRRKMAVDLTDLNLLARNLSFESAVDRVSRRKLRALEAELVPLLPLMTAVEDRIHALREIGEVPDSIQRVLRAVSQWTDAGEALDEEARIRMAEMVSRAVAPLQSSSTWPQLLANSLTERLTRLIDSWQRILLLSSNLLGTSEQGQSGAHLVKAGDARRLHLDHGLAAYAGLAVGVAVLAMASFAYFADWAQGAAAVGVTAAGSSVFAFADNPSPFLKTFLKYGLLAIPTAAFYVFAVFPFIDGIWSLALVMFPLLMLNGYFLALPKYWLNALSFALVLQTQLALQPNAQADFITFTNVGLATLCAVLMSLLVTQLIRVISPEVVARRILRAGWRELSGLAIGATRPSQYQWVSRMIDRLALLNPRLAPVAPNQNLRGADALVDLRVGINVGTLRSAADELRPPAAQSINATLQDVGLYFKMMAESGQAPPAASLLKKIDDLLASLLSEVGSETGHEAALAAAGLRRGLFPGASAFQATQVSP
jgi:uncharacterized membrane protein YccC